MKRAFEAMAAADAIGERHGARGRSVIGDHEPLRGDRRIRTSRKGREKRCRVPQGSVSLRGLPHAALDLAVAHEEHPEELVPISGCEDELLTRVVAFASVDARDARRQRAHLAIEGRRDRFQGCAQRTRLDHRMAGSVGGIDTSCEPHKPSDREAARTNAPTGSFFRANLRIELGSSPLGRAGRALHEGPHRNGRAPHVGRAVENPTGGAFSNPV